MRHLHGILSRGDVLAAGVSRRRLEEREEFEPLARGVWALPGARRDFWFHAALGVTAVGPPCALTGLSALQAHGVSGGPTTPVQLCVPEGRGLVPRHPSYRLRRTSHMPNGLRMVSRIPTVPVAYALCDLARDCSDADVAAVLSAAQSKRAVTLRQVARAAEERGRFPGSARLRRVMADFAGEETHSRRERRLRAALRRRGIILHPGVMVLRDVRGLVIAELDIAIPSVRIDVEVDGPHHDFAVQVRRDKVRDRAVAALDWLTLRYSIYEIDADVERIADEILRHVTQRMALPTAA